MRTVSVMVSSMSRMNVLLLSVVVSLCCLLYLEFSHANINAHGVNSASIIGDNFTLVNHNGVMVSSADFKGKCLLIMFGFSRCGGICPFELNLVSDVLQALGDDAAKLQFFFISFDPNDDVATLKKYHERFDSRIQMLTGNENEVRKIIDKFKVYVGGKSDDEQISHSSLIYIMNRDGKYITHFAPQMGTEVDQSALLLKLIRQHISCLQ